MLAHILVDPGICMMLLVALATMIGGVASILRPIQKKSTIIQSIITSLVFVAFVYALKLFKCCYLDGGVSDSRDLINWIVVGDLRITFGIVVDQLASFMLLVITSVSCLVHMYSIWYMQNEKNSNLFFFYISLFTFLMMTLVVSNNFIQLFFGWEGVGLCSYLLIGFWGEKPKAGIAANKAFVMNRIGDFGLIVAIALIFRTYGSVGFDQIFSILHNPGVAKWAMPKVAPIAFFGLTTQDIICLSMLLGCIGKSAQAFLYGWLPDAMEGPTPASALIHAATMVTAGVFLMAKCSLLYDTSHMAQIIALLIGVSTALCASVAALAQKDIKKIVAYSTCSQLGYMFAACGIGCYGAAMFHLFTHAFFKSLLFLCSGSIIHAACGEQDISKIGNLSKAVPVTKSAMIVASLAISGVAPFSGYYSKDAIIELTYVSPTWGIVCASMLSLAALFTSVYSWKIIFSVFTGPHNNHDTHSHESKLANIPMILLAIMATASGYLGINQLKIWGDKSYAIWTAALHSERFLGMVKLMHHIPTHIKIIPSLAGVCGIFAAYIIVSKPTLVPTHIFGKLFGMMAQYLNVSHGISRAVSCIASLCSWGDVAIVDRATSGYIIRATECGTTAAVATNANKINHCACAMLLGVAAIFVFLLMMF